MQRLCSRKCEPGDGWPSEATDYAKKNRQSFERDYPYTQRDGSCHSTQNRIHVGQRISGKGEDQLENMLQKGAVSVCLDADILQNYRSGVIGAGYSSDQNHAVTAVALTTDCNGRAAQCWVVKNSWGSDWGEHGYLRVDKGKNSLGIGAELLDLATGCSSEDNKNNNNNNNNYNAPYGDINNQDLPGDDIAVLKANERSDCTAFAFNTCGNGRCWLKNGDLSVNNRNCRASEAVSIQAKLAVFAEPSASSLIKVILRARGGEHNHITMDNTTPSVQPTLSQLVPSCHKARVLVSYLLNNASTVALQCQRKCLQTDNLINLLLENGFFKFNLPPALWVDSDSQDTYNHLAIQFGYAFCDSPSQAALMKISSPFDAAFPVLTVFEF
ncbi:Clan CA, family C1, cathepsin L-like cysteine peptidase [Planoprotostelium fungivorum]|uniref:Clan CA, family C1, cathepsin L-like cysteine peptidase n=1 Tax=Planoprotostelium fungivorum TaxID=1890364 RepID=A0A2P6N8U9_9EUKA|nr:Clan CA, family C1, cathepsin L-like cysteine peptidase [Planoprotostelium fungivorum]